MGSQKFISLGPRKSRFLHWIYLPTFSINILFFLNPYIWNLSCKLLNGFQFRYIAIDVQTKAHSVDVSLRRVSAFAPLPRLTPLGQPGRQAVSARVQSEGRIGPSALSRDLRSVLSKLIIKSQPWFSIQFTLLNLHLLVALGGKLVC